MAFEIAALNEGLIDPAATSLKDVEVQELFKAGKTTFDVAGWAGNLAVYTDPAKSQVAADVAAALMPNVNWQIAHLWPAGGVGHSRESPRTRNRRRAFIQWMLEPATMEAELPSAGQSADADCRC